MSRRPGLTDRVLGTLGAAVIATVLWLARVWAKLTRTPWHGD